MATPSVVPSSPSSWRTTVLGILTIVAALVGGGQTYLTGHSVDFGSLAAAIMAGIGLIKAKDHAVTG